MLLRQAATVARSLGVRVLEVMTDADTVPICLQGGFEVNAQRRSSNLVVLCKRLGD